MKSQFGVVLICVILLEVEETISQREVYTVGALFHRDDGDVERIFKCAVKHFNLFNNAISFKTSIKYVPKDDVFTVYQKVCKMLAEESGGLVGLFGPPTIQAAKVVQSVTDRVHLPHVQVHRPSVLWPYKTANLYSINFYPNLEQLQTGLGMIIHSLHWRTYAILYEDDEDIIILQEVIKSSRVGRESIIFRKLGFGDFREILKEVKHLGYGNIVLNCNSDFILDILKEAKELDMLGYLYRYFLTPLDAYVLDFGSLNSFANITTIRITDPQDKYVYRFAKECDIGRIVAPKNSTDLPDTFVRFEPSLTWDAINFFMNVFQDLRASQEPKIEKVTCGRKDQGNHSFYLASQIKNARIPNTVTGQILFEDDKRSSLTLEMADIIKGDYRKIAVWNSSEPDKVNYIRSKKDQQDLVDFFIRKVPFDVYSRIGKPYLMPKTQEDSDQELKGNDAYEGFSMDIIDHIAKSMNFSYRFHLTENNKYGSYNKEKKSWDGLIKDILDRRAHLAICDLTITQERRSAVDFSLPFMTLGVSILYSKSKPQERDIFAFMTPLHPAVWLYILVAFLSITFVLYLLTRLAPGDWENPNPTEPNPEELENIWDLKNSFWLILGSAMSQGSDLLPKGISPRMGISMWWFFILIINSSYTASLSAFLTTSRFGPTIDSAESLAQQSKIKYGVLEGGSTQSFFKNSNFTTYQKMWTHMSQAKPTVFVKDNAEGVKRVKTTKNQLYAFLMESSSIEYETERDCDLKQVGGRLDSKGYGIAMPVDAPYRGAINSAILKMQEDGTLRKLKTKWWKEMHGGGACKKEPEVSSDMQLAMANIGGIFVVVFCGLGMAGLLALVEFLWNVRAVAVDEHKTYQEILRGELKFFATIWKSKKGTYPSSKSTASLSETSLASRTASTPKHKEN